jgi:hypothetical protein
MDMAVKRKISRSRPGADGFTLMEVVTAVFIFLVGIVGVISLFAAAGMLHKSAHSKTMVSLAVQQVITEIDLKLKTGELRGDDGELAPVLEGAVSGQERFTYRVVFEEEELPGRSMILARVQLTWREKGKERGEAFDYVFRPGPDLGDTISALRNDIER